MNNPNKKILAAVAALMALSLTALANEPLKTAIEPFKIAVAGVTHGHLGGVVSQLSKGDIQVVGVWEADPRYLHKNSLVGKVPESAFYSDLGKMLDETKPEAVVAYGSIKEHLAVVEACAPRGIHVMVEKPLATTFKDAQKMAALARKHGIFLMTNYETTWYSSNHYVKKVVDEGGIGPIFRIEVYDGHRGPVEIGCSEEFLEWLTDPVLNGGGAVMDFGCYGANLATWLLGGKRPTSVYAVLQRNKPDIYPKVDDDATIVLEYPGATVEINASWCWPIDRKDMYVYGMKGLLYQADPRNVSTSRNAPGERTPELAAPYDNPYHYLEAVVHGKITVSPADLSALENNVTVVEILSAAVKSAKTGKPVKL